MAWANKHFGLVLKENRRAKHILCTAAELVQRWNRAQLLASGHSMEPSPLLSQR